MLSESELTVWMQMEDKSDHILVIEAGKSHSRYLRDLWLYRELFLILAWRDIIVRYKQTIIGIAWSIIRPLLGMIVFTVVFGKLAKLPSEGVPYPLMVYAGMLMWQFFSSTDFQRQRIPAGQLQPDLQSLLPASDHPLYQHDGQPYGFPDLGGGFHSAVFLVWDNPVMEDRLSPLLHSADGNLIPWRHLFHFVPEREIP